MATAGITARDQVTVSSSTYYDADTAVQDARDCSPFRMSPLKVRRGSRAHVFLPQRQVHGAGLEGCGPDEALHLVGEPMLPADRPDPVGVE